MTAVSSPSPVCAAIAPLIRPALVCASYHALRRPASSAFAGGVCASFGELLVASTPAPLVVSASTNVARPPAQVLRSSSRSGQLVANGLRGGCCETGRRAGVRRRRRRPRDFLGPAIVWAIALAYDYDLWWRRGPWGAASAASSPRESTADLLRFARGRVAGSAVACRKHFVCFHVLLGLALLSHIAVTAANPGFLQPGNQVLDKALAPERWCDRCQGHKPPRSHHCRRCGSCVARMDHHCVFAANCIGAGNLKQLLLFMIYAAACAVHAIFLYSCLSGRPPVVVGMIFCWLCGLLTAQLHGIGVGAGAVDRLQAANPEHRAAERVAVPHADEARLPGVALGAASQLFYKNRGIGFGALRPNANAPGAWNERADSADSRIAKAYPATCLRRGRLCGAAVDGNGGYWAIVRGASFCRALWSSLHEETLGEGPWLLWLVPTPARLSPEAEASVYGLQ